MLKPVISENVTKTQCLSESIYGAIKLLEELVKSHDLPSLYDLEAPESVVA